MRSTSIDSIETLTADHKKALKEAQVVTAEEYRKEVTADARFVDTLTSLDAPARAALTRAMAVHDAVESSKSITARPIGNHVADVVIVLAVVATVAAIAAKGLRSEPEPAATTQVVVASVEGGVPPFHVIRNADVSMENVAATSSTIDSLNDVIGRYAFEHISQGQPVDRTKLSAGPPLDNELDGLQLVGLTLPSDSIISGVRPPVKIGVAASSAATTTGIVVDEVYLLHTRVQPDGIAAVIATTAANVRLVAPFLAGGKFAAVWPVR